MKRFFTVLALACALGLAGLSAHAQDKPGDKPAATAPAPGAAAPAAAPSATPAPTPNKGDVAWMLTSTALVLMMSIPGLALFYGGMVRAKNMLSVLMQVFVTFSLITVLWCIYGYSLAFTEGNGCSIFRRLQPALPERHFRLDERRFRHGRDFQQGRRHPELVFVAFQATFAAITCCLIVGAFAERMKFSAVLIFMVIWFTFAYAPIAHMVWFWMGPDAYTDPKLVDELNAKAGPALAMGRARFRGRHRRAHQCGRRGSGRRLHGRQTHRLRPRSDDAAQRADDDDRGLAVVGGLVRIQRGLRARSGQLGSARFHQHFSRHGMRGSRVDLR